MITIEKLSILTFPTNPKRASAAFHKYFGSTHLADETVTRVTGWPLFTYVYTEKKKKEKKSDFQASSHGCELEHLQALMLFNNIQQKPKGRVGVRPKAELPTCCAQMCCTIQLLSPGFGRNGHQSFVLWCPCVLNTDNNPHVCVFLRG